MASRERTDADRNDDQPLVRPPDLNRESDRSATRLELFFDLAFVLAVGRVADRLGADPTWRGAAACAALLVLVWWAWATSTLYANRFDTDDVVYRLTKLASALAVIGAAASIADVGGPSGRWFAACYGALRWLLSAQYVRAWRHVPAARPSIKPYLIAHTAAGALWFASIGVPASARFGLWALALAVDAMAPLRATRSGEGVPLHLEHLPERHGLFVILVLGESIVAIATGVEHAHWNGEAVAVAVLGFVLAAALWWAYFDVAGAAAKQGLLEAGEASRFGAHDVYLFAHLPLALALTAIGVGLEKAVEHGADPHLPSGSGWMLGGGVALYLGAMAVLQAVPSGRPVAAFPVVGVPFALAAVALATPVPLLGALGLVLLGVIVAGHAQRRTGRLPTSPV